MKELIQVLFYMVISVLVVFITLLVIDNVKPINHTHDKELEEKLIDKNWTTREYYNDEYKYVVLSFNKDHTLTYNYIDNNKPADLYYKNCNKWNWSNEKRIINIECNNKNSNSTIEIIKITDNSLTIKTYKGIIELNM